MGCTRVYPIFKNMKKLIVGIDISKDVIDYCVLEKGSHQVIDRGVVQNERSFLNSWIKSFDLNNTCFSMEHTGHYGALLSWLLSERKAVYYMINALEIKRSLGIQRGKTDAVDAYRIASYSITNNFKLSPFILPCEELLKLKAMMTVRQQRVKMSVQLQNSIKANLILNRTVDISELIEDESRQLESIKKSISFIDRQMLEIIKSCEPLEQTYNKITKVIGVGPITAMKCIIETANFTKFDSARKFSCHSGLAPFPYQSGSSVKGRTRTHYLKNSSLKSILFKAAASAIQHDPQLKNYYNRKLKDGKHKLCALNAVANKVVLRIFAVQKREEPFVKLAA